MLQAKDIISNFICNWLDSNAVINWLILVFGFEWILIENDCY